MLHRVPIENRDSPRKRLLKGGVIAFSARHATLPCVVRDISETGARLQVEQASTVPDTFELIVDLDGLEVPCAVVWRKLNEVGVAFTAAPSRVAPKRAQVVGIRSPYGDKLTLRRAPVHGQTSPASDVPAPHPVRAPVPGNPAAAAAPSPAVAPRFARPAAPSATIPILIADDDPDDRMLIEDAFRDSNFRHPIAFVENGEELLKYLRNQAPYTGRALPGLVLLDLNMPKMDGRTALMHLKTDPQLKRIPVIVLTTSNAEDDIQRTYDLGVSAFVPKPNSLDGLIELVRSLNDYWMRFVAMPAA